MNLDLRFEMADILPLLPIPQPPYGKTAYNIPCPYCDRAEGRGRHLNINLKKNVFCCPKCGSFSGGVFDLYSYYEGVPRDKVYKHLKTRLEGGDPGESHRDKRQDQRKRIVPPPAVPQAPLADIDTRDRVYRALLEKLSLAQDHYANLLGRGLDNSAITRLQYRTTPTGGLHALTQELIDEEIGRASCRERVWYLV